MTSAIKRNLGPPRILILYLSTN